MAIATYYTQWYWKHMSFNIAVGNIPCMMCTLMFRPKMLGKMCALYTNKYGNCLFLLL